MAYYQTFFCDSGGDPKQIFIGSGGAGQFAVAVAGSEGKFYWANTLGGSSGEVYAATGNSYIVTDLASDLTNEFRLVQSGNSVTINTAGNLVIINAVTNETVKSIEGFRTLITTTVPSYKNLGFIVGDYDCTALATQQIAASSMRLIPFFVKNSMFITNAYLNVTSAGVGGKFIFFIYDNSSDTVSYPFKNIVSSGYLAGSSVAVVSFNIGKILSGNSIYWAGILVQATANVQFRSVPLAGLYPFLGMDTAMGTAMAWGIGSGYTATTNVPPSFNVGGVALTDALVPAILLIGSL